MRDVLDFWNNRTSRKPRRASIPRANVNTCLVNGPQSMQSSSSLLKEMNAIEKKNPIKQDKKVKQLLLYSNTFGKRSRNPL